MKWQHLSSNKTETTPGPSWQEVILSLSPPQVTCAELVSRVLMRLTSGVISLCAGETGSPKAIYSFNGLLMRFVLHLPVLSDAPLGSDEAELFIWGSCSRPRRTVVHLGVAAPASLMCNFFSGLQSQGFFYKAVWSSNAARRTVERHPLRFRLSSFIGPASRRTSFWFGCVKSTSAGVFQSLTTSLE